MFLRDSCIYDIVLTRTRRTSKTRIGLYVFAVHPQEIITPSFEGTNLIEKIYSERFSSRMKPVFISKLVTKSKLQLENA